MVGLCACGGGSGSTPASNNEETIESLLSSDPTVSDKVKNAAGEDMTVDIKGNTITYTYDISNLDGVTEELAKSDEMKESFASALEGAEETFSDLCAQVEDGSGISGVKIIVRYTYKGELLAERTFTR